MKKPLKITTYVFLGLVVVFAVAHAFEKKPIEPRQETYNQRIEASSDSMEPTLKIGEVDGLYYHETPKIGDMISFRCLSDECRSKHFIPTTMGIVHRLTAIDPNGCMTIVGDNPKYNWSQVPCFMPSEIKIEGVVHKL